VARFSIPLQIADLGPAKQVPDQRDQKQDQEDKEQDLRDARRRDGNACEAKQRCYQCHNEKR
jgi:hypothetical protein